MKNHNGKQDNESRKPIVRKIIQAGFSEGFTQPLKIPA